MKASYLVGIAVSTMMVGLVLRSTAQRLAREMRNSTWARVIAAARIVVMLLSVALGLVLGLRLAEALSPSLQTFLLVLAGIAALPWLLNGIAGLTFLSRARCASVGDHITTCGHAGRICEFGVTGLELESDADNRVLLSYFSVVREPLLVKKAGRSADSVLVLERSSWTEDDLRFVRQTAVMAPYRDVTAPVAVEAQGERATISMALVCSEAEAATKRLLLGALAQRRSQRRD